MAGTSTISIVMRSKNDGSLIGGTLRGVYSQNFPAKVEVIHIDSGSTDETVEVIKASGPHQLIQIRAEEYVPGIVLNRGMRESAGEWVVFLNSDGEPSNNEWLSELVAAAQTDKNVGAAFSRQIPRADCRAVFAHDYEQCFGVRRVSHSWDHFFSMVSCIVNRQAWEAHPFREDLQYAEDDEWSRRIKANGWKIVFAEKSVAIHSHNYTLKQAYKRAYGDTFALAATSETPARNYNLRYTVGVGTLRDLARDAVHCVRQKQIGELPHAAAVRFAQRLGKMDGYRAGWKHYGRSAQ